MFLKRQLMASWAASRAEQKRWCIPKLKNEKILKLNKVTKIEQAGR